MTTACFAFTQSIFVPSLVQDFPAVSVPIFPFTELTFPTRSFHPLDERTSQEWTAGMFTQAA